MKEIWNKITSALSKFFKDVYSKVLTPIGHFFQFILNWCYIVVFTPVGHFFQFIWNWCYTVIFTPVGHFFNKGWNWFINTKTGAAVRNSSLGHTRMKLLELQPQVSLYSDRSFHRFHSNDDS